MDGGLPGPDLMGDGFGDGATVSDYVVKAFLAPFALPGGLRADQPSTSAGLQSIMREAEPVDAEVGHLRHVRECGIDLPGVFVAVLFGEVAVTKVRRVADDGIGLGPGREEGVGAEDVLVQVVQRQVALEYEGVGVLAGELVGVVFPKL